MDSRLERLYPGHAVAEKRARLLDVFDVTGVAQTALAAVLFGGIDAPFGDGSGGVRARGDRTRR